MTLKYYNKKTEALQEIQYDEHLFSEDYGTYGAKRFLNLTRERMYELIKSKEINYYYENIEESDAVKLHFDIDIKVTSSKYCATYLNDKIKMCIQLYNKLLLTKFKMETPKIIILDASIDTKLSAHIIYTNVHFKTISELKHFILLIDKDKRDMCHIDMAIYRVGCLRMCYNSKIGKNNKLIFKRSCNHIYDSKRQVFMDSLITNIDVLNSFCIDMTPYIKETIKVTKNKQNASSHINLILTEEEQNAQFNDAKNCIHLLSNKRADSYSDWILVGICLHGIENSTRCFNLFNEFSKKGKSYENEFVCIRKWNSFSNSNMLRKVTIGTLKFWAKEDNPAEYTLKFSIPSIKQADANKNIEEKKFESIKFEKEFMIDVKETILSQSQKGDIVCKTLVEFIDSASIKTLIIKSAYNTGKTSLLSSLFKEYGNQFKKILMITYRKSLTSELMHNFDYYNFCSYESECFGADRLICQIESLHKIDPSNVEDEVTEIPEYDLIIVDEVVSALNHYMSPTIDIPESTFNNMCDIISKSKKLICLDGDVDERCYDFSTHFGKIVTLENTIKKNIKNFKFIKNVNTFDKSLSEDLKNNKNIFLICLSASVAKEYAQIYKEYKVVLYCGDADDDIKKGLNDVENEWLKYQLVIITPCVESGVSFNKPHFYKEYIILSEKSTSQRGVMQMTGRVRQFESNEVLVHLNKLPYYQPNYYSYFTYNEVKEYVKHIKSDSKTNLYETINIHNHVEKANKNKNNFISYFLYLCDKKGHTYSYDDVKSEKVNRINIVTMKEIIASSAMITNDKALEIRNKIIKSNATQVEKQCFEKYMYIAHWKITDVSDDSIKSFFNDWYGKTYVIYNLRNLLSKEDYKVPVHKDTNTYADIINFKDVESNVKNKYVAGLLVDLGFNNVSNKISKLISDRSMAENIVKTIATNNIFNLKECDILFDKGKNSLSYIKEKYIKDGLSGEFIKYINLNILGNYGLVINITRKCTIAGKIKINRNMYKLSFIKNIDNYI